jgi:hypothetical protein
MKIANLSKLTQTCRTLLVAALALVSAGALQAANFFDSSPEGINLGNARGGSSPSTKNWSIFALSAGVTITDPDNLGPFATNGNIALGGTGAFSTTNSLINGNVYLNRLSGGFTNSGGTVPAPTYGAAIESGATTWSSYLTTAVTQVTTASSAAAGLAASGTVSIIPVAGNTIAFNGITSTINAVNAMNVLNLTDLILSNSTLILNGTSSQNFVVNVNRYMTLSAASNIQLTGGLTSANVLFNVKNNSGGTQYDVTLSGGSKVNGIILAATRNVKLTGASVVYGEVIGKGVALSGKSRVLVSP